MTDEKTTKTEETNKPTDPLAGAKRVIDSFKEQVASLEAEATAYHKLNKIIHARLMEITEHFMVIEEGDEDPREGMDNEALLKAVSGELEYRGRKLRELREDINLFTTQGVKLRQEWATQKKIIKDLEYRNTNLLDLVEREKKSRKVAESDLNLLTEEGGGKKAFVKLTEQYHKVLDQKNKLKVEKSELQTQLQGALARELERNTMNRIRCTECDSKVLEKKFICEACARKQVLKEQEVKGE